MTIYIIIIYYFMIWFRYFQEAAQWGGKTKPCTVLCLCSVSPSDQQVKNVLHVCRWQREIPCKQRTSNIFVLLPLFYCCYISNILLRLLTPLCQCQFFKLMKALLIHLLKLIYEVKSVHNFFKAQRASSKFILFPKFIFTKRCSKY